MNFLKSSNRIVFFLSILCLVVSINAQSAFSAEVTLAWDQNSEPAVAGYRLYYGTLSRSYQYSVDVGNTTTSTVSGLDEGKTYYCAVTAYDTQNNESDFSGEVIYTVPVAGNGGDTVSDTIDDDAEDGIIYEDAEDGTTNGWDIYDNKSGGAKIINILDGARQSRVIQFSGSGISDGYQLRNADGSNWLNSDQFIIQWSMNYSETFYVYIEVETDQGRRYIYYTPVDDDSLGGGAGVHHGLGQNAIDGQWHTYKRDLQADLGDAQPSATILQVNAFLIRGSGKIDDIKLIGDTQSHDNISVPVDDNTDDGTTNDGGDDDAGINDNPDDGITNGGGDDGAATNDNPDDGITNGGGDDGTLNQGGDDSAINDDTEIGTMYEDAEDKTTNGWDIYDNSPTGATITNIFDNDRQSRVIQFSGSGTSSGYRLRNADGSNWLNSDQFIIQWSMNYSETFYVYIEIETDQGYRYIYYTPVDFDNPVDGVYVHYGLGEDVIDGQWHTFVRDLQADLENAEPGLTIIEVNGFLIRGSGKIDDIKLIHDTDLLDDPVELVDDTDLPDDISVTVYEDADDGTTNGWDIYDNKSGRAKVINILDGARQSRVIQFSGSGISDGYRLRNADGSSWLNSDQFIIQWSMNYSETFYVYIEVETNQGRRYIYYTPAEDDSLGGGAGVHHGLGQNAIDGQWHTYKRDLQADLGDAQPGATILQVNAFLIRGSGKIDDIKLSD